MTPNAEAEMNTPRKHVCDEHKVQKTDSLGIGIPGVLFRLHRFHAGAHVPLSSATGVQGNSGSFSFSGLNAMIFHCGRSVTHAVATKYQSQIQNTLLRSNCWTTHERA